MMVSLLTNFNPRPREGSDLIDKEMEKLWNISIHAPAKGATLGILVQDIPILISIHAPAKGATFVIPSFHVELDISIHAPAKGAT